MWLVELTTYRGTTVSCRKVLGVTEQQHTALSHMLKEAGRTCERHPDSQYELDVAQVKVKRTDCDLSYVWTTNEIDKIT